MRSQMVCEGLFSKCGKNPAEKSQPTVPQDREPGDAVGRVRKRSRERVEVLHHLLLAQLLDLHRA